MRAWPRGRCHGAERAAARVLTTAAATRRDDCRCGRSQVAASGVVNGTAHLVSQHTTVALTINEDEARLRRDYAKWLLALAPPDAPYLHNDLEQRPETERDLAAIERNWMSQGKGTLEEFMAQEPLNAHAHLLASLLGTTLSVPVVGGELAIGQWQSVLMVELDGPRMRKVGCQVCGYVSHDDEQH